MIRCYRFNWALICLALLFTYPVYGQVLPEGKFHSIRDRQIDILHYKANIQVDLEQKMITGSAMIRFTPLASIQEVSLDAIRLSCTSVGLQTPSGNLPLQFAHKKRKVVLQLNRQYSRSDTLTVVIDYSAKPNAGMYFLQDPTESGSYFVYTYGEGGLLANVFPIYNDVNDKFSSEMIVTVPSVYTVISNGRLLAAKPDGKGNTTFHWLQKLPHSNYLISIYIGQFERGELPKAFGSVPLHFWVPRGRLSEGAFAFRNTSKMVEFFSDRFQYPYPWDKYDQMAVPDYAIGAMEHTGVTGHRASVLRDKRAPIDFGPPEFDRYFTVWSYENTISHELAHHWFGDNLTCASLTELWLNESFATYCQMLYDEYARGKDAFDFIRLEALDRYLQFVKKQHLIRPMKYNRFNAVNEMYTTELTYLKGALILHMLRTILGDDGFFQSLHNYLKANEFSNVTSSDLLKALRETTGKNLTWFFNDWIFGGGYPILEVKSTYLKPQKALRLEMDQVQPHVKGQDLFVLPISVFVVTDSSRWERRLWLKRKSETFFLPCDSEPLFISLDNEGALVADIRFEKSLDELLFQAEKDKLRGRVRALRQLALRFSVQPRTVELFRNILSGNEFWGLRAETARLLSRLDARDAEPLLQMALKADDYRIRKAAVLSLAECRPDFASKQLRRVITKDPHSDVVATAIVALARIDPEHAGAFIRKQLNRPAWYDEIDLACLKAFEICGDPEFLSEIKPFTANQYHEFLQIGALNAWRSCKSDDEELHARLLDLAVQGKYNVRLAAIEMLGDLCVKEAEPVLKKILKDDGDLDFRVTARKALAKIKQLNQSLQEVKNGF